MTVLDRRRAGLLVPLFSLRSRNDWGVGEYPDLAAGAAWARTGGFSLLLTLPLYEPSPGLESPYSSGTFFALDPLYLALDTMEDFAAIGGRGSLTDAEERELEAVTAAPRVAHGRVRALKEGVLRRCFRHFVAKESGSERARDLARFRDDNAHWLADYALFRTLKAHHPVSWRAWPVGLAERAPAALEAARKEHAEEIEERIYLQWLCYRQLEHARKQANALGVALAGDEPFLVAEDSADVWASRQLYRFDATVGAPPDAFSADGQEWGLPPYRWDAIKETGYQLFENRGRHTARVYDVVRIDHVVGLYRTYHRPIDKSPHFFYPREEAAQLAQGEAVLSAIKKAGVEVLAEDLGVIPPFVRASLERLAIPGYRVLRWEQEHGRFRDPEAYPRVSVATTGTHDTESSIEWWERLPDWERTAVRALPRLASIPAERATSRWSEELRNALLETVYRSSSDLALLPIQDVLDLRDRVNTPNTVGPENWSWRMPWTLEGAREDAIVSGRMSALAALAKATQRD